jgi:hypothetical protein
MRIRAAPSDRSHGGTLARDVLPAVGHIAAPRPKEAAV